MQEGVFCCLKNVLISFEDVVGVVYSNDGQIITGLLAFNGPVSKGLFNEHGKRYGKIIFTRLNRT